MWILIPFFLQAIAMTFDEIWFHRKRGLPLWERIGHPIDTFSFLICVGYVLLVPYSKQALMVYLILSVLSCLMVTKDEFVHKHHCLASEHWVHALLFVLHPITLASVGWIWYTLPTYSFFLVLQSIILVIFMSYQIIYWNFLARDQ